MNQGGNIMKKLKFTLVATMIISLALVAGSALAAAPEKPKAATGKPAGATEKPNIVVIWGDDIGITDVSAYSFGMMGFKTPNIDKIAKDGMMFTDYYAEQSCTAGRSTFITGQLTVRTGLSKVGMPGAKQGLQAETICLAQVLKNMGYATGQFGKNHLGDRDEFLPTNHGFDEFYGNLYHLNAEEEPELPDYPKNPEFRKKYGPRGVIHSFADGKIEDTGPLTKKRMETIDDDVQARSQDFIERQVKAKKPFFVWVNYTHMHLRTHAKPSSVGQAGPDQGIYHDVMIDHDKNVGAILDTLDKLGVADNTIVFYSTDNGPHMNTWPDAAMTPFRNEKDTGWEGAFRVPAMIRWPGHIKPGQVSNEIFSGLDWFPTLVAAAGDPDIKEKLLKGYSAAGRTFKNHLDGYNQLPYLTGKEEKGRRNEIWYFSDEFDLLALRYNNWKLHFQVQDVPGTLEIWQHDFRNLRIPYFFNLRTDPFERATITSNTYWDWVIDHVFLIYPMGEKVGALMATFKDYPPVQLPGSFTINGVKQALEKLEAAGAAAGGK
jgi:arylsulfatase A-like enzyme